MKKTITSTLLLLCTMACFAQWQWQNPLPNGYTGNKIKFTDANKGFILNSSGDLISTVNRGASWKIVSNFPNTLCMDMMDSTGVIAGYQGSVYLSTDNGTSWQKINTGIADYFSGVTIVSRDVFFLYNSGNTKLYKTADRGKTWTTLNPGNSINSMSFVNAQVGYLGSYSGKILKTTDGGNSWQTTSQVAYSPSSIMAIQFISKDTGYAFRQWSDFLATYDGGVTWKVLSTSFGFTMNTINFVTPALGYMGGDDGVIYKTIDSGKTWASVTNLKSYGDGNEIYSMHFFSKDSGFAVGGKGRIQQTADGGVTWKDYSPTYANFTAIHFPTNTTGYATTTNNVFKTNDGGNSWQPLNSLNTGLSYASYSQFEQAYFISADTGFVTSSYPAKVYRTNNGGATFDTILPTQYSWDNITDIFFLNRLTGFMNITFTSAGSQGTIVKTKDGGKTWTKAWEAAYQGEMFTKIFYLNEAKGFAVRYDRLFMTTDSSKTWTQIYTTQNYNWLTSVWFVSATKGFLTGEQGKLYETSDGGQTWTSNTNYIDTYTYDFYWMKFFNDKVGYLYDGNIFKTYDGGKSWHINGKAPNGLLKPIQFRNDSAAVVCGGMGNILTTALKGITVDSLKVLSNTPCSTTVSVNASAAFTSIDSIWFELTDVQNNVVKLTLANPVAVSNGTVTCVQVYNNLLGNSYSVRVKYLYNNTYIYTDAINFVPVTLPMPFITKDSSNTFISSAVIGNQWYFNGTAITGATNQKYTPEKTGSYTVMVNKDSCHSSMSFPVKFVAEHLGVTLFPNPAKNYLVLNNTQNRQLSFSIIDFNGKVLMKGNLINGILNIPVTKLSAAAYLISITDKKTNDKAAIKFIKVN